MTTRLIFALLLVGFVCLCSGADIRNMLEELLRESKNETPTAKKCVMDGKMYENGERWVDERCTARCSCLNGAVGCVDLCPPVYVKCDPGEVESTKQVPADKEGRCFCRVPVCVKKVEDESKNENPPANKCVMDGKKYENGERWVDERCTARCSCLNGAVGCVDLCPPVYVKCGPGEVKSTKQVPADKEGRCFCRVPVCVKKVEDESKNENPPASFQRQSISLPNKCVMDGKTYENGERWVDERCTARCSCLNGAVGCVDLCPPVYVKCGPGEVESTKQVPAGKEGRCFCRVPVCVKKDKEKKVQEIY
ncbi:cysteine-rich motor neuron 1 protein-like isoform X6 [Actinia tenebrosa]|uniref:Cysteine-rich motor neuron 1 protein-like isoform X6 n=1 Tax=Actinia tenebrosa TaxID=6105 RepID=A0A6P8H8I7_ACTTE|nr:cysteine-rich motor neuron 1 protein-like isoform X6 [Actinia tenebrosa]